MMPTQPGPSGPELRRMPSGSGTPPAPSPESPGGFPPPPGMRLSRILGVLALGFSVGSLSLVWLAVDPGSNPYRVLILPGVLMFLLAVPLSILAMVFGRRARRKVRLGPKAIPTPAGTGLGLGLLALAGWGLVLFLLMSTFGGNPRARDRAVISNMRGGLADLAETAGGASAASLSDEGRAEVLDGLLASWRDRKNPWDRRQPWLNPRLIASGPGKATAEAVARQQATILGQVVFVLSSAGKDSSAQWLVGAVLTKGGEQPASQPGGQGVVISETRCLKGDAAPEAR